MSEEATTNPQPATSPENQSPQSAASAAATAPAPAPPGDIIARAGKYYRNTRFILAAGLLFYSLLSIRDGFFRWPHENQIAYLADPLAKQPHTDVDVAFNKVIGVLLPPIGLLLVGWALRNSRGEIRLIGQTLSIPGHPPVPLAKVESVDKSKWDRKGIALVTYRNDSGRPGTFKLDDFVYERTPIDQIFERIEQALQAPKPVKAPPVAAIPALPRVKFPPPPPRPRLGR